MGRKKGRQNTEGGGREGGRKNGRREDRSGVEGKENLEVQRVSSGCPLLFMRNLNRLYAGISYAKFLFLVCSFLLEPVLKCYLKLLYDPG